MRWSVFGKLTGKQWRIGNLLSKFRRKSEDTIFCPKFFVDSPSTTGCVEGSLPAVPVLSLSKEAELALSERHVLPALRSPNVVYRDEVGSTVEGSESNGSNQMVSNVEPFVVKNNVRKDSLRRTKHTEQ